MANNSSNIVYTNFQYVLDGCTQTLVNPIILPPLIYRVEDGVPLVILPFPMPVSSQSPTCGAPYSYSLFNTYQGALTVEAPTGGSDGKIKLDTSLILPSGYNVEYTNFLEVRYQVYGN